MSEEEKKIYNSIQGSWQFCDHNGFYIETHIEGNVMYRCSNINPFGVRYQFKIKEDTIILISVNLLGKEEKRNIDLKINILDSTNIHFYIENRLSWEVHHWYKMNSFGSKLTELKTKIDSTNFKEKFYKRSQLMGCIYNGDEQELNDLDSLNLLKDSVITYQQWQTDEKQCKDWLVPDKNQVLQFLNEFEEIEGWVWNDCYGDWSCGAEGSLIFQEKQYHYTIDAGGWVILTNKNTQRYFGCNNKKCWDIFPSESFCNEDWSSKE